MTPEERMQLAISGASNTNQGLAQLSTLFSSPTVQAAAMQEAAERTRGQVKRLQYRFDQEEFKKVKALHFDSNAAELRSAEAALHKSLQVSYGPVTEAAGTVTQVPNVVDGEQAIPLQGKEGQVTGKEIPAAGMPPRGAMPPQGRMETRHAGNYNVNGLPVAVSSRAGMDYEAEQIGNYWRLFGQVVEKNMATAAEFGHNELIGKYALDQMQLVQGLATKATGGMEMAQNRETEAARREKGQAETEGMQVDNARNAGLGAIQEGAAQNAVGAAARNPGLFAGAGVPDKLIEQAGKDPGSLTRAQQFQLLAARNWTDQQAELDIKKRTLEARAGVPSAVEFSAQEVANPNTWERKLRETTTYESELASAEKSQVTDETHRIRMMKGDGVKFIMKNSNNISEEDAKNFIKNGVPTSELEAFFEAQIAGDRNAEEVRKGFAYAASLEEQVKGNGVHARGMKAEIDAALAQAVEDKVKAKIPRKDAERWALNWPIAYAELQSGTQLYSVGRLPPPSPDIKASLKKHAEENRTTTPVRGSLIPAQAQHATLGETLIAPGKAASRAAEAGRDFLKGGLNLWGAFDAEPGTVAAELEEQKDEIYKFKRANRGKMTSAEHKEFRSELNAMVRKKAELEATKRRVNLKADVRESGIKSAAGIHKKYKRKYNKADRDAVIADLPDLKE